jgi:hypothetical protein
MLGGILLLKKNIFQFSRFGFKLVENKYYNLIQFLVFQGIRLSQCSQSNGIIVKKNHLSCAKI